MNKHTAEAEALVKRLEAQADYVKDDSWAEHSLVDGSALLLEAIAFIRSQQERVETAETRAADLEYLKQMAFDDATAAEARVKALEAAVNAYCSSIGHRSDTRGPLRKIRDDAIRAAIAAYEAAKPAPSAAGASEVVADALRWIDNELLATKRVMEVSVARGNGYANFAAHEAHKQLTAIRSALTASPAPAEKEK